MRVKLEDDGDVSASRITDELVESVIQDVASGVTPDPSSSDYIPVLVIQQNQGSTKPVIIKKPAKPKHKPVDPQAAIKTQGISIKLKRLGRYVSNNTVN